MICVIKILLVSVVLMMCLAYPSNSGGAGEDGISGNIAVGVSSGPQGAQAGVSGSANAEDGSKNGQVQSTGQEERPESGQVQNREVEQETVRTRNGTGNGSTVMEREEVMARVASVKAIQDSFVAGVKNISQNASPSERAGMVSALRLQVNAEIKAYLENENESEANLTEIEDAVGEGITVSPTSISSDSFIANAAQKKLTANVRSHEMVIEQEQNAVSFGAENGVRATAREMTVANNTLRVDGQEVTVLPSEAAQSLKGEVQNMEMAQVNGRLAYTAQVKVKAKLLGLIDTQYEQESAVDAQTGQVISEKKPWWSFLAFG